MLDFSRIMNISSAQNLFLWLLVALTQLEPCSTAHAAGPQANPRGTSAEKDSKRINDIPPRIQWTANFGYCGETALLSAGLYYGQYVSQYDARAIASRGANQSKRGSQLLLGVNDRYAAARMHLKTVEWDSVATVNANKFLAWVKSNVASGFPVIIGVYENFSKFENSDDENAGDDEYDHIVPVVGVWSNHPVTRSDAYHADDVLMFSDNGLWSPNGQGNYLYRSTFGAFQADRRQANDESGQVYSLPRGGKNHGIAIVGIIDRDGKTLPVRLTTDVNEERPAMREGANTRPAAETISLTVTVSGLRPGVPYTLYRYDSFSKVPESAFNANASHADKRWKVSITAGSTYVLKETIRSNQVAVYRAVPETAP